MTKLFFTSLATIIIALNLLQVCHANKKHSKAASTPPTGDHPDNGKGGMSKCRLKYSGILVIEDEDDSAIVTQSRQGNLTRTTYEEVDREEDDIEEFQFYECMIDGYYHYPDEYGFLVARSIGKKYCATAYEIESVQDDNGQNSTAYGVAHSHCEYFAADKEKTNRQLAKATYIPGEDGQNGRMQITFEGSPDDSTRTGFTQPYANYQSTGSGLSSRSEDTPTQTSPDKVVLNNNNDCSDSCKKMAIDNPKKLQKDSMRPGYITDNEYKFQSQYHFKQGFSIGYHEESEYGDQYENSNHQGNGGGGGRRRRR